MGASRADIERMVREYNVKFIYLQLVDIAGILKSVTIPVSQLAKALDGELMFDGSSIEGYVRIEESDMYLRPDYNSFTILPWGPRGFSEARLICDVYTPEGSPFAGCPRCNLKRMVAAAESRGLQMQVGPEVEFFLFHTDAGCRSTTKTHDRAGYFDLAPIDLGENARRDMVIALDEIGFQVEASHHEVAPGQHEIGFRYCDALTAADRIATFKHAVRVIAQRHGLHASFMPKPAWGIAGSGMHCHQSLFKGAENVFFEAAAPRQLSQKALHYIAGVLSHARGFSAVTNPIPNSYKRLVTGYEAPVYIAWSEKNRSPMIRIPAKRGLSTRIEVRSPDPACNPYLALAVMLKSGLHGIETGLTPPPPIDFNLYDLKPADLSALGIASLPGDLGEALRELEKDAVVGEALGSHIYDSFTEAKWREWDEYRQQVHCWETSRYLKTY